LIIGGNIAEGLLAATIPLAHLLGVLTVTQIYVVGLLSATAFVFSDAAVFGAVPALVSVERLPSANGLLASMASIAEIVGPALGGVLAATIGPSNAIWLDAASFLAAAGVQATIRSPFRTSASTDQPGSIGARIRRAVSFVMSQRALTTLMIVGFGNSFAFGIVIGLLVPYAAEVLQISTDGARIGVLYAAGGVGALVAGIVFGRIFRRDRVRVITPVSLAIAAATIGLLLVIDRWWAAALVVVVFFAGISTAITTGITYRQLASPDDLRSSVNVLGRMVAWGGQPFGAAAGAVIAAVATVDAAYTTAAIVMAVTAVCARVGLARADDRR
jgi:predicted MFS family arabinose efflux permease